MHSTTFTNAAVRPATPARVSFWDRVMAALAASASRRALRSMSDRELADSGIDRGQALHEASRRPWDLAPPDWR